MEESISRTDSSSSINRSSRIHVESPHKAIPNKPPRGAKPWRTNQKQSSSMSPLNSTPDIYRSNSANVRQSPVHSALEVYRSNSLNSPLKKLSRSCTPQRALEYAFQSVKYFEEDRERYAIELTTSLHALAAVYCRLRQFGQAVSALERSIKVPNPDMGVEHQLAVFSGYMHLGDTYALMGRPSESLRSYHTGLDLQKKALGDKDARVAQTTRYLAEAHLQNMQFKEAEAMCEELFRIHSQAGMPGSLDEASDRRLMALICNGKGDHESALEYLVLASMSLISNGHHELDVACVQASIGDTYVALERYDDAVFAFQKALTVFKSAKGEEDIVVGSVYVSLADLYLKTGKQREARTYCDTALRIFTKHDLTKQAPHDEVTSGLTEIASIYATMNEPHKALNILTKVLDVVEVSPGRHSYTAAIEAQIGVLYSTIGKYEESLVIFKSAITKLRCLFAGDDDKKNKFLGMVMNQMGLACVELYEIGDAAQCFQEARNMLESACGPEHMDTLAVSANLAATYNALGRLDEAIKLLKSIIKAKEAAGNTELENEKKWLQNLLKERG